MKTNLHIYNGIWIFVIRGLSIVFGFATGVFLARSLGVNGYGAYSFVLSIINLIVVILQFGIPQLVLRETAKADANGNWSLLKGLWRWSNIILSTTVILILVLGFVTIQLWPDKFSGSGKFTWQMGLLLGAGMVFLNLSGAKLIGMRFPVLSQLVTQVIRPGLFLFLISIALLSNVVVFQADSAMALHVLAMVGTSIICVLFLKKKYPVELKNNKIPAYNVSAWVKSLVSLSLTIGLQHINSLAGVIVLGVFVSNSEVGIYQFAFQISLITLFVRMVTIPIVSPYIARYYEKNNYVKLQHLISIQSKLSFLFAAIVFILFTVFGREVIAIIGGEDYVNSYSPMVILTFGYLFAAYIGSGEIFLVMIGGEKSSAIILGWIALLNFVLLMVLVPNFGVNGAAFATAISYCVSSIAILKIVKMRININIGAI